MSEYWKSVPRKFCDFCKCWITDNKPSVDFHERGKRHQENVELRLKEVRKKSYERSLEQDIIDKQMVKMEKAAMKAFKKDLAANPELAKQYGVSLERKLNPQTDTKSESSGETDKNIKEESEEKKECLSNLEWWEGKSPEGYSYYWSTVTGETKWEAPGEFLSLKEQEATKKKEESTSVTPVDESEEETVNQRQTVDPGYSRSAFGAWNVVKVESRPKIYDVSSVAPAPEDIPLPTAAAKKSSGPRFKEKTVTSLGPPSDSEPTSFKRRKIASGARNVRKRGDDD